MLAHNMVAARSDLVSKLTLYNPNLDALLGSSTDITATLAQLNAQVQAQLISDLLDVSRITTGKLTLDVQPFDPAQAVEIAVDSVRATAEARGVQIKMDLLRGAEPVMWDPVRFQQVVWNLLSNAIKFTPRDGEVQVVLAGGPDGHAEVSVSDSGEGIPPEFLPHVFDRLRQADASITRKHGGLGLGLSIVKAIAESHGGRLVLDAPAEGGFVARLQLPS